MSTISFVFGLSAALIRMCHTLHKCFVYYLTMKISVHSTFKLYYKILSKKIQIYKYISYFMMCFIYFSNVDTDESLFYMNALINVFCFIIILNMYLFIIRKQNQMLLQTLLFFIIYQFLVKLFHIYLLNIIFVFSGVLILLEPINQLRKGLEKNDGNYFNVDELVIEIIISFTWLLYSLGYNVLCFIFLLLISLFIRICAILGFEIVKGKIKKDTKIYKFLINVFFINVNLPEKSQNNIL